MSTEVECRSYKLSRHLLNGIIGAVSGAILIAGPYLMIFKGAALLSIEDALLRLSEFCGCVSFCFCVPVIRQRLDVVTVGFCGLFLYCALCVLCHKLGLGVIDLGCEWWQRAAGITGACFAIAGMYVGISVLSGKYSSKPVEGDSLSARLVVCFTLLLVGIALVYHVWLPIIAVPGWLVLIGVFACI